MQISVKANTYIYLAILLLIIPLPWVASWLIAVTFHELCHWLAVKLCRSEVYVLKIGIGGAEMQCGNMTQGCRLFSVLCGPVGGFLLVGLGRWLPKVAICSFCLSVYNFLPLLPLDGGRALCILMKDSKRFYTFEKMFLTLLVLMGIFCAFFLELGIFPLAFVIVLWLKKRKIPCK